MLFSSYLPFVSHLLSQGPFPMLTIIIFLFWDPSHSLYVPSNPYTVPYTTTGQGTLFAYLFLVMNDYSFSRFSHICSILLLLILLSMTFHDIPFLLSGTFYLVPSCSFTYSADLLSSIQVHTFVLILHSWSAQYTHRISPVLSHLLQGLTRLRP